ncbi:hypothetical protein D3C76_720160 [compost metagenome]
MHRLFCRRGGGQPADRYRIFQRQIVSLWIDDAKSLMSLDHSFCQPGDVAGFTGTRIANDQHHRFRRQPELAAMGGLAQLDANAFDANQCRVFFQQHVDQFADTLAMIMSQAQVSAGLDRRYGIVHRRGTAADR